MSNLFEKVSRFSDDDSLTLPVQKTKASAGYDFIAAEDIIVPSWSRMSNCSEHSEIVPATLSLAEQTTKKSGMRPTLIPTGVKCKLDADKFLMLVIRSSSPLKYGLILANGVGIIDADYYNNPSNEGEIFFQVINLLPFDIKIQKGDTIGQGLILNYNTTDNKNTTSAERVGGFGSTTGA